MIFYNKTLHCTNIVLRVVCRLHLYEAQRLFSVYHVFAGHIGNVDIKRAVWAQSASVFWFWFYCFSFNFSSVVVCIFHFYCCVFLVLVLPSGVIKNDKKYRRKRAIHQGLFLYILHSKNILNHSISTRFHYIRRVQVTLENSEILYHI